MRKRYRNKDDQMHFYLLALGTAIQIDDDGLLIYGDRQIGQILQQSFDLYHQLGQPGITEYRVTFQKQQVIIRIHDQQFHLPLFEDVPDDSPFKGVTH